MNRKAYNKVHERYYADPVGFITGSMPNVTVKVSDEHGNATKNPKNIPYNECHSVVYLNILFLRIDNQQITKSP